MFPNTGINFNKKYFFNQAFPKLFPKFYLFLSSPKTFKESLLNLV